MMIKWKGYEKKHLSAVVRYCNRYIWRDLVKPRTSGRTAGRQDACSNPASSAYEAGVPTARPLVRLNESVS
jgi:hypothetical protein